MKIIFAVLLILHGLIVTAQSSASFKPVGGTPNPAWMAWFPANLGQSWLFSRLGLEQAAGVKILGLLWLLGGLAIAAAGLGILGFIIPVPWWRMLALVGGLLSLLMLSLYFHPFYLVGIAASILVVIAILARNWTVLQQIGL